jgi:hypothetical protein
MSTIRKLIRQQIEAYERSPEGKAIRQMEQVLKQRYQGAHGELLRAAERALEEDEWGCSGPVIAIKPGLETGPRKPAVKPIETQSTVAAQHKALIDAYKREGKERRIKITDKMIAKAACPSWNDRTPVQRWKRNDRRSTKAEDLKIRAVLHKKPHLT